MDDMMARVDKLEAENQALRDRLRHLEATRAAERTRTRWFVTRIGSAASSMALGTSLRGSLSRLFDRLADRELPSPNELAELVSALLGRIIRVGLLAILLALLPQIMIAWQNRILIQQSRLMRLDSLVAFEFFGVERRRLLEELIASARLLESDMEDDFYVLELATGKLRAVIQAQEIPPDFRHPSTSFYPMTSRFSTACRQHERAREYAPRLYAALVAIRDFVPESQRTPQLSVEDYEEDIERMRELRKRLQQAIQGLSDRLERERFASIDRLENLANQISRLEE